MEDVAQSSDRTSPEGACIRTHGINQVLFIRGTVVSKLALDNCGLLLLVFITEAERQLGSCCYGLQWATSRSSSDASGSLDIWVVVLAGEVSRLLLELLT